MCFFVHGYSPDRLRITILGLLAPFQPGIMYIAEAAWVGLYPFLIMLNIIFPFLSNTVKLYVSSFGIAWLSMVFMAGMSCRYIWAVSVLSLSSVSSISWASFFSHSGDFVLSGGV